MARHAVRGGDGRHGAARNHLEVAYADGMLVACTTVRPPNGEGAAVVIVRVLPAYRPQGYGRTLYARPLEAAYARGAKDIEPIVWAPNVDGLKFALANGFVETERHVDDDDDDAYITLRLDPHQGGSGSVV